MLPIDWKWASVWSCAGCFDEASDCIWITFNHHNGSSESADAKTFRWRASLNILESAQKSCHGIPHCCSPIERRRLNPFACEGINWEDTAVIRPGQLLWADTSICQAPLFSVCSSSAFCKLLCHLLVWVLLVLPCQKSPWGRCPHWDIHPSFASALSQHTRCVSSQRSHLSLAGHGGVNYSDQWWDQISNMSPLQIIPHSRCSIITWVIRAGLLGRCSLLCYVQCFGQTIVPVWVKNPELKYRSVLSSPNKIGNLVVVM